MIKCYSYRNLHVVAARASNVHEVGVGGLNKALQLVLLGLLFSRRITEIVDLHRD